jgi:hypothetical protein
VGAGFECVTGKGFDHSEWRISDDGRRRRFAVEEILNQASRLAAINDVSGDDGIAGRLGCLGDAAKPGTGVQRDMAAIKVFDLEQPDRNLFWLRAMMRHFTAPDLRLP